MDIFLWKILKYSQLPVLKWPFVSIDLEELKTFAQETGAQEADNLRHWDIQFWSERLRESKYDIKEVSFNTRSWWYF